MSLLAWFFRQLTTWISVWDSRVAPSPISLRRTTNHRSRCDANLKKGKARKLPLSKPKEIENVIISDARSWRVELVPANWDDNINDVETKTPLLTANSSWTKREKKSFWTTILLLLPSVELHMRKAGRNSTRSKALTTSIRDMCRIRWTGICPDINRPNKSPMLKNTKLKGT